MMISQTSRGDLDLTASPTPRQDDTGTPAACLLPSTTKHCPRAPPRGRSRLARQSSALIFRPGRDSPPELSIGEPPTYRNFSLRSPLSGDTSVTRVRLMLSRSSDARLARG